MLHLQKQLTLFTMENTDKTGSIPAVKCTLMSNSIKYGLYTGLAMVLLSMLFYSFGLVGAGWTQYVSLVLLLAGIIMGAIAFRDKCNGGFISYGRSVGSGVLIGLVVGIILAVFTYVFLTYFDAVQIAKMVQTAEEDMMKKGLTDDQIDQAMSVTKIFMTPAAIAIMNLFWMPALGAIISLITSIFIKKDRENFEEVFADVEN